MFKKSLSSNEYIFTNNLQLSPCSASGLSEVSALQKITI